MQPVVEFFQRARQRINARIAILAVVCLLGTVAVWQGYRHLATAKAPTGPKKQVATGPEGVVAEGGVQTAGAMLPDEHLPGAAGGGNHQLLGAAQRQSP
jgi:hypothetical protein